MRITSTGAVLQPNQPAFYAAGSTSTSYSGGSIIGFSKSNTTNPYDQTNSFNNSTSAFTAPVGGLYHFDVAIYVWSGSSSTVQSYAVYVNGSAYSNSDTFIAYQQVTSTSADQQTRWSFTIKLNSGDYIQIGIRPGAPTLSIYAGHTYFQGFLVG